MLKTSHDRKVSVNHGKGVGNSFGIPAGISCPGKTATCERICYAGKLEKIYPNVRGVLMHNWDLLKDATRSEMLTLINDMITSFSKDCDKRGVEKKFRIHWDGDFFSYDYALAWATVISVHPDVQFWAYTRSFEYVGLFERLPNLSLYLSVDKDNLNDAKRVRIRYRWVRWAYLDETMADAAVPVKDFTGRPGAMCPENVKRIPLITEKTGACISCNLCVEGKADVRFAIRKR